MPSNEATLYPLKFEPIYKEKVWGGRTLESLGRSLPGNETTLIGESWELVDLGETSPSGGGGGQERSVIANGPLAGQTLNQAIQQYGPTLLGRLGLTPLDEFPLLVKFLDARQHLSVQVHPSVDYAQSHPESHLKSEAWYIVEAEPDAVIYKGVQQGVTAQQFRQAIEAGTVEQLMIKVPVKAGDCHYLPSGTCHALGTGILVAEVQTPSDTTFRVFDWGRTSRELHIEPALQCIQFGPPNVNQYEQRSHVAGMFTTVSRLVTCEHFCIEKVRMVEGYEQEIPYDQPAVWMVLEGGGRITLDDTSPKSAGAASGGDGQGFPVTFERGQTLLMPASLGDARVVLDQNTVWLEITFPQAMSQQIA